MAPKAANPTRIDDDIDVASETTPLLQAPENTATPEQNGTLDPSQANGHPTPKPPDTAEQDGVQEEVEGKKMPYLQVLILCYASLGEPVAFFAIFPFVNEMIALNGNLNEKDVGFYSGLIESLFSLTQMLLMIFYGRAADRLGRKPVLVFSLTGVGFATALFGMSKTVWQMIVTRCLAGVFAGSVVTVRTMLSENTDKGSQARAFSWYMFTRNLGIFLGPIVGGALANPTQQMPSLFAGVKFWETYPYALPTFAAGIIVLSSAVACMLFLNETLVRKAPGEPNTDPPMSTWEVLKSPGVPTVLGIYGHVAVLGLMFTALLPVFMYTSVPAGGFGFSDPRIALFMAIGGGSQALWMLLAFPFLQGRLGTGAVLKGCVLVWALFMAAYPLLNEVLRAGWTLAFWILGPIVVFLGSGVAMAYACTQLCVNDITPSPAVLGTLNALALTVQTGVRAFSPILATSIFAWGVKWGFAHGHLAWFVLIVIAVLLNVAVYYLPEKAQGRPVKKAQASREEGVE